ncbi:hypothetical protein GCM10009872_59170 [Actinopolymorpha rutila]
MAWAAWECSDALDTLDLAPAMQFIDRYGAAGGTTGQIGEDSQAAHRAGTGYGPPLSPDKTRTPAKPSDLSVTHPGSAIAPATCTGPS